MYASGYQIAAHTIDRPDLDTLSSSDRRAQVTREGVVFKGIIGHYHTFFCLSATAANLV